LVAPLNINAIFVTWQLSKAPEDDGDRESEHDGEVKSDSSCKSVRGRPIEKTRWRSMDIMVEKREVEGVRWWRSMTIVKESEGHIHPLTAWVSEWIGLLFEFLFFYKRSNEGVIK